MREARNPFLLRTAEYIESDANFLRLFSPGVLDLLSKERFQVQLQILRSSPGGGKTSLFRIFTPASLLTLYESRAHEDFKDLYNRMKALEVVNDGGPQLLGIALTCARNYAVLEDLSFDSAVKECLLYSLINARLIMAALRGALVLKKLRHPDDLSKLSIKKPVQSEPSEQLPVPSSGEVLYEWACSIEKQVCEVLDSFGPPSREGLEILKGHFTLDVLSLLRPECILYEGVPVASQFLVMLDDVHKLTWGQRQKLLTTLLDLKIPITVWVAERLEALNPDEMMAVGSTTGREYGEPIYLEDFWRDSSNSKRFENVVTNIADRRARLTRDLEIGPFSGCLQDSLDSMEWQNKFMKSLETIQARVYKRADFTKRYESWIRDKEAFSGTSRECAIEWRILEILIERDIGKNQLSLPPA